jgi:hypothetical protein
MPDYRTAALSLPPPVPRNRGTNAVGTEPQPYAAFLESGIKALVWLERCEEGFAEASSEGIFEIGPEVEEALEALHTAWLRPCTFAERWIVACQQNGYDIANLAAFRDGCERARDWLERNDHYKRSASAREERFAEEPW